MPLSQQPWNELISRVARLHDRTLFFLSLTILQLLHLIVEPTNTFAFVFSFITLYKEALRSFSPHCFDY
ncbi:hypothetical protein HanRHA438_Chr06g0265771 [Helianthus annuus]|nr:hypothetical protein HanRHA438_Chr06g0265771 [Helianthus annuus]